MKAPRPPSRSWRRFLGSLAFLVVTAVGLVGVSPARADGLGAPVNADEVPTPLRDIGITEHLGAQIPTDVRLRDEQGREVRVADYLVGKRPVVLNFVYHSCPTLCGMVMSGFTAGLKGVPWSVGEQFDVLTVSIDPRDTPAVAAQKKQQWVAAYDRDRETTAKGWHFLTGDPSEIKRLTDAVGFSYAWNEKEQQFAHAAAVFVVTPGGVIARYLYGITFSPFDLRLALAEASEGRTVTTVEHLLLYCYQYDPNSRSYVLVALNVMRLGAAATVLVLGSLLAMLWRREMRRKRRLVTVLPPA